MCNKRKQPSYSLEDVCDITLSFILADANCRQFTRTTNTSAISTPTAAAAAAPTTAAAGYRPAGASASAAAANESGHERATAAASQSVEKHECEPGRDVGLSLRPKSEYTEQELPAAAGGDDGDGRRRWRRGERRCGSVVLGRCPEHFHSAGCCCRCSGGRGTTEQHRPRRGAAACHQHSVSCRQCLLPEQRQLAIGEKHFS